MSAYCLPELHVCILPSWTGCLHTAFTKYWTKCLHTAFLNCMFAYCLTELHVCILPSRTTELNVCKLPSWTACLHTAFTNYWTTCLPKLLNSWNISLLQKRLLTHAHVRIIRYTQWASLIHSTLSCLAPYNASQHHPTTGALTSPTVCPLDLLSLTPSLHLTVLLYFGFILQPCQQSNCFLPTVLKDQYFTLCY
jgi:hypothetical protein